MFRLRITGDLGFEVWQDIEGYEGLYQASTYGRIKGLQRTTNKWDGERTVPEKIIKFFQKKNSGYLLVSLYKNGVSKKFLVSRLIYSTFYGSIPIGMQVNHINENKQDNSIQNLNLMTPKENTNWGTAIQRRVEKQRLTNGKKVVQMDKSGNIVATYFSAIEAARQNGYCNVSISLCCRGKQPEYRGYIWRYA